ncbi:uncharacterized protein J3R85_000158 [Psidium guajava]|nr:uncharacterized protein J3R85_000158 [Psidium guajava]
MMHPHHNHTSHHRICLRHLHILFNRNRIIVFRTILDPLNDGDNPRCGTGGHVGRQYHQ